MEKEKKFILMNIDDKRSKKIAEVMGNATCKKIIDYLTYNSEKSEEDIAKSLGIKLNTTEYNLKKLLESGLVEKTKNFFWSKKGKKIPLYKLAKKHIVISPSRFKPDFTALKSILPVVFVSGIGGIVFRQFYFAGKKAIEQVAVTGSRAAPELATASNDAGVFSQSIEKTSSLVATSSPFLFWIIGGILTGLLIYFIVNLLVRRSK